MNFYKLALLRKHYSLSTFSTVSTCSSGQVLNAIASIYNIKSKHSRFLFCTPHCSPFSFCRRNTHIPIQAGRAQRPPLRSTLFPNTFARRKKWIVYLEVRRNNFSLFLTFHKQSTKRVTRKRQTGLSGRSIQSGIRSSEYLNRTHAEWTVSKTLISSSRVIFQ